MCISLICAPQEDQWLELTRATCAVLRRLEDRKRDARKRARRLCARLPPREAIGYVAMAAGISAEDVRDLMSPNVERRFGQASMAARFIERLLTTAAASPSAASA